MTNDSSKVTGAASPEQVVVDLLPAGGLGLEIVRRIHDRLVAALLRLELGDARRDVRVHRQVVVVAEYSLAGARDHEVDEQPGGVRMRRTLGDAGDLQG